MVWLISNCWAAFNSFASSSTPSASSASSFTPSSAAAFLLSFGRGRLIPSGNTKLHAARLKILNALLTDLVACAYKLDSKSVRPAIEPTAMAFSEGLDSNSISALRSAKYLLSCQSDISSVTNSSFVTVATNSFFDPL